MTHLNVIRFCFSLVWIFIFCSAVFSQEYCDRLYDNQWILGGPENNDTTDVFGGSLISFMPEYLVQSRKKKSGQLASFAVISSKMGNLLLYTNGCDIFDFRDSIIENGTGLNPGEIHNEDCPFNFGYSGLHNMFFLPSGYDTSIYYLFHIGEIYNREPNAAFLVQFDKFYMTTVHSSLDNGFLEVIDKNKIIFTDTGMIGMPSTAVRHANGLDWWVITPDRWESGFHIVFLDQTGPQYLGKQYLGKATDPLADGGQGKFSPDGTHFAWYQPRNGLFLYDFDRSTGFLSNFQSIDVPVAADLLSGGLEFSPSGRFLYVNHYFSLYQLDMLADDLQSSLTHIADYDGFGSSPFFTVFYHMERTPDKRIFMNPRTGSQWLHVIQEPEKKGTACRFEQHVIQLPTVNNYSFPHFPNYRLGALGEPLCDSMVVNTNENDQFTPSMCLVYPNPSNGSMTISIPKEWIELNIYATDGTLHFHQLISSVDAQANIDISTLSPGLYILQGSFEPGEKCVHKILISH